jgi:RHS repeat-associated protein
VASAVWEALGPVYGAGTQEGAGCWSLATTGALAKTDGRQTIEPASHIFPLDSQGSHMDPSGLTYLVGRYYDPATGQSLSVDPAVMTTGQPYSRTDDDPLKSTDPTGSRVDQASRRSWGVRATGAAPDLGTIPSGLVNRLTCSWWGAS